MVSIKKFLLFGAALVGAIPLHDRAVVETGVILPIRDLPSPVESTIVPVERSDIEARAPGRMTLQWSPQGRIMFLLGMRLPQSVLDSLYGLGEAGPAKALMENFFQFMFDRQLNHQRAWLLFLFAKKGGVYGKGVGAIADTFGFGLQTASFPTAGDLQDLLEAINAWATQGGSIVQVIARPNGFFDLPTIGAGGSKRDVQFEARARSNQCPANTDLLRYATQDVPDIDINNDIRWSAECDE